MKWHSIIGGLLPRDHAIWLHDFWAEFVINNNTFLKYQYLNLMITFIVAIMTRLFFKSNAADSKFFVKYLHRKWSLIINLDNKLSSQWIEKTALCYSENNSHLSAVSFNDIVWLTLYLRFPISFYVLKFDNATNLIPQVKIVYL